MYILYIVQFVYVHKFSTISYPHYFVKKNKRQLRSDGEYKWNNMNYSKLELFRIIYNLHHKINLFQVYYLVASHSVFRLRHAALHCLQLWYIIWSEDLNTRTHTHTHTLLSYIQKVLLLLLIHYVVLYATENQIFFFCFCCLLRIHKTIRVICNRYSIQIEYIIVCTYSVCNIPIYI